MATTSTITYVSSASGNPGTAKTAYDIKIDTSGAGANRFLFITAGFDQTNSDTLTCEVGGSGGDGSLATFLGESVETHSCTWWYYVNPPQDSALIVSVSAISSRSMDSKTICSTPI